MLQASTSRLKARTADAAGADADGSVPSSPAPHGLGASVDKLYMSIMKDLQFGELPQHRQTGLASLALSSPSCEFISSIMDLMERR